MESRQGCTVSQCNKMVIKLHSPKSKAKSISQFTTNCLNGPELDKLLHCENTRHAFKKRDLAIISLLSNTGLRVSELVGLNQGDVRENGYIRSSFQLRAEIAKRKKARPVVLNEKAQQAIKQLICFYKTKGYPHTDPGDALIQGRKGRLSRVQVFRIIKDLAAKANLGKKVTPHTLRHTFSTQLLKKGANLKELQMLLGHSSLSTTSLYLHPSLEDLENKVGRL